MKKTAIRRLGCALIALALLLGGCADGAASRTQGISDTLGLDISAATPLKVSNIIRTRQKRRNWRAAAFSSFAVGTATAHSSA